MRRSRLPVETDHRRRANRNRDSLREKEKRKLHRTLNLNACKARLPVYPPAHSQIGIHPRAARASSLTHTIHIRCTQIAHKTQDPKLLPPLLSPGPARYLTRQLITSHFTTRAASILHDAPTLHTARPALPQISHQTQDTLPRVRQRGCHARSPAATVVTLRPCLEHCCVGLARSGPPRQRGCHAHLPTSPPPHRIR
jgi:hypothetical protein